MPAYTTSVMTRDPLLGIGTQGPGAFLHLGGSRPGQGFSLTVELSSLYPGVAFVLKNAQPWVSALFRDAHSYGHCLLIVLIQGHPFLYPDTSQTSYPSSPEHLDLTLLSSWLVVLCGGAVGQEGRDILALPVIPGRELAYCSDAPCGTCLHRVNSEDRTGRSWEPALQRATGSCGLTASALEVVCMGC